MIEVNPESVPMPDRISVCGLVLASSETVSVPVSVSNVVGVNLIDTEQLAPAPSVFGENGQLEVCTKLSVAEMLAIVKGTVWLFLIVTLFAALTVFNIWLAKDRLVGDNATGVVPLPVNCSDCGEFDAL